MESGLPMLNCLLQHTLRSLCSCSDSSNSSSKWVYAVFWRILPRNYPPPKWGNYGGSVLDRSKGNKRNWILVWEDGFCDLYECEQVGNGYIKGRFGADVFFKMSHEVYNYGEGLVGKVAADNSHKWVFRDTPSPNEGDPNFISSWNVSTEPQPRAWEFQFNSGIQTIAVISVREGIIQLGSFDKILEDLNLVVSIQMKFSYLQSIPGVFAMQRSYLPIQHPYILKQNPQMTAAQESVLSTYDKRQLTGAKRLFNEMPHDSQIKSINLGWDTPQNGLAGSFPSWPIPPLLPSISSSLGVLLSKLPPVNFPSYNVTESPDNTSMHINNMSNSNSSNNNNNTNCGDEAQKISGATKIESSCHLDIAQEENKHGSINPNLVLENGGALDLEFGPVQKERPSCFKS